jgi:hypothetical protein
MLRNSARLVAAKRYVSPLGQTEKMKYSLTLLLLLKLCDLTSQIFGIDTLKVFSKKYPLTRKDVHLTGSNNSFLSTTPSHYYLPETIQFKYLTQADNACRSETSYDAEGASYTRTFCNVKRENETYLTACKDSLKIDFDKLNYNSFSLKQMKKVFYFDLIEFILQYDTLKIKLSFDQNAKQSYSVLHDILLKYGKPRLIILNQMLYIDPKTKIAYDVPTQFVFFDK